MFERYTQEARRVIFYAREEACGIGSTFIETEHLLLGLLREDRPLADLILGSTHASIETIRTQLGERAAPEQEISPSVAVPLSEESKCALKYSAEEADRVRHRYIGTEHMLAGLLREEQCLAAKILNENGVSVVTARENVIRAQGKYYPPDLKL